MTGGGRADGGATCRACGAALAPGAVACARCGAPQIDDAPCLHCGAVAAVTKDDELRVRCGVCGAPRLPLALRGDAAAPAVPALRRAEAARHTRAVLRFAALVVGASAALATLVAIVLAFAVGAAAGIVALAAGIAPLAIATALLARRARERSAELTTAIDEAWVTAAAEVAERADSALGPEDLATALDVDVPRAEALLALLDARDVVRADVTEGGELRYRARVRVEGRVPEPSERSAAEADALAAAEDEEDAQAAAHVARTNDPPR